MHGVPVPLIRNAVKTGVNPLHPRDEIHRLASTLFCRGGWRGLQAVGLCRTHDPRDVLRALEAERRRSEASGAWGNWGRLVASLAARKPP